MNDRNDFEELLWSDAVSAGDGSALDDQLEIHHLLRETVARRPSPTLSPDFDATLARRLRLRPAARSLSGRGRTLMTLYWLAVVLATGVFLGASDLPLPPVTPWTLVLWSLLVPASFLLPSLTRRLRTTSHRLIS